MAEEMVKREEFNVFSLFDRLDDSLIIQELEGRLPEVLTYHYQDKGQDVWGLSKSGVDEASNELAKKGEVIREVDLTYTVNGDEAYFICKAARFAIGKDGREIMLDTKIGTKRQDKVNFRRDGTKSDNKFWFEQGSIKAARNAASRLIPASIKAAIIEYAKAKGKVRDVRLEGPQPEEKKEAPPPSEEKPKSHRGTIKEVAEKMSAKTQKPYWTIKTSTGDCWTGTKDLADIASQAIKLEAEMVWTLNDKGMIKTMEVARD